jgi:hypothetical protein
MLPELEVAHWHWQRKVPAALVCTSVRTGARNGTHRRPEMLRDKKATDSRPIYRDQCGPWTETNY